ncbi:MAG: hypothetical protein V1760_01740, partial [Candidatus Peregrinibacteria bacterium]
MAGPEDLMAALNEHEARSDKLLQDQTESGDSAQALIAEQFKVLHNTIVEAINKKPENATLYVKKGDALTVEYLEKEG